MPLADDLHKGQLLPLKLLICCSFEERKKVLVGGIKNGYFTVHNLMCVCDNKTLLCLTENFIQPYNGNKSAFDKIAEHITRTYGRELVGESPTRISLHPVESALITLSIMNASTIETSSTINASHFS